ncbi:MAG: alpha/beta fold hydrolase [Caldilinea sp. CFX5]|nr:alpha/beta fold hydrolase [Caldilinea sp. CFX5]
MVRINSMFTILLLVALIVSACQPIQAPAPGALPEKVSTYTPRYEPADCPYEIPASEKVECGYLIVPEDRSQPDGPTIRVHVVNFKSRSDNPAPDPIFLLPGGPGSSRGLYLYLWTAAPVGEMMRANRDVIMIEQRGANYSEPAFYCPEMAADLSTLAGMSFAEEIQWSQTAYRACYDRLVQEGQQLAAYRALEGAADVADLRIALGYGEVNIYGVSYGTLPALHLLRDQPTGLRSVIVDSPWPPQVNEIKEMLNVTNGMLNAIFQACAADPVCNDVYPDLAAIFTQVLADLREQPVSVTVDDESAGAVTVTIDDLKFIQHIRETGFAGDNFTGVPAAIYAAHEGDFAPAAKTWLSYLNGRHGATGPGTSATALGLYYSVECAQNGAATVEQTKAIYAASGANASLIDYAEQFWVEDTLSVCRYWDVAQPAPASTTAPAQGDTPTLFLANRYDIFYAPAWSRAAVEHLSNGYFYELPASHGAVLTECGLDLIAQFLADPTQAPDASCIDTMTPTWVLPE